MLWLVAGLLGLVGCQAPMNPSFPLTEKDAKHALAGMAEDPKPLQRPVVIVGGYGDPGFAGGALYKALSKTIDDGRILRYDAKADDFDELREQLIAAVNERFPTEDADATTEVDVVANSMGGLIAVYAADPDTPTPRLRMKRLFALATPFLGANMANSFGINELTRNMQSDSDFIARLNRADMDRPYTVIPYARLGDTWVGIENTAPEGEVPWWVPTPAAQAAHLVAFRDPRIHADIARRLRGETPFTTEPRAPLPED